MLNTYKILFTGPVGAGKTTAITSLSDTPPVLTESLASDGTMRRKPTTTVALDYGVMRLSVKDQLHLYGTPGQERFDFMWDILGQGALGLVVLVDNAAPDPVGDLRHFAGIYRSFAETTGLAVGVTRTDLRATPGVEAYVQALAAMGLRAPVFRIDARRRHEVALLVEALLYTLEPDLDA